MTLLHTSVTVQIKSYQVLEVLTLSLCCSVVRAGWFWLFCSVSRSRLHPSWKMAMKKGDGEAHPQRNRYVMGRLIEGYFEVGEGKKEEERLSHTHWMKQKRRERVGSNQWERGVRASERKKKFFTAAQRQIVWFKLCAMDVRGTLGGNSPGAHSQLEAVAGFLGKWAETVMSSKTEHFHGNKTSQ